MSDRAMEQGLEDLGPIVDGEKDATERHADTLADSDALRDAVFEAKQVAAALPDAGADFEVPADLEARILAKLDARAPAPRGTSGSDERGSASDSRSTAGTPEEKRAGGGRGKVAIGVGVGLGLGLAIAAAIALVVPSAPSDGGTVAEAPDATLEATVEAVARAGHGDAASGLSARGPGGASVSSAVGARVAAGSTLRTDDRTRARVGLSDGSTLSLQQDTELVLDAEAPRTVRLGRGEVYAEMAHLERGPRARFLTTGGVVEVVGTKLLLSATDAQTSVRVTQGVVALEGGGHRVEVKAGEEGILVPGQAPVVMPAVGLAASVAWTELGEGETEEDLAVPGLGELRARRPGEREDRERPLTLAHHAVKVRISGNVARTEIEETFQNDGPDTLEGIYSFPLPADARIASLALEVDGRWEEGAFVARDRAARIWRGVIRNATPVIERNTMEEFIWVPGPWRDPALLEWQQGGRFELRIFPIPARGARRIRIAYEQTVAPHGRGRRYVYPLPHASATGTPVGRFEADVRIAGASTVQPSGYALAARAEGDAQRLTFAADSFEPSGSMIVDYAPAGDEAALRYWAFEGTATAAPPEATREQDPAALEEHRRLHGDTRPYVAFALRPQLPAWSASRSRDYVVVVDASQSMIGERYDRAVRLVETMVEEMDPRDRVAVLACDATCRAMDGLEAPNAASASHAADFLRKERPAGASNVVAAIREAVDFGARHGGAGRAVHVVYVGDGLASVGPRRASSIAAEVREARRSASVTTVGIGQEADSVVLAAMAREGGGHYVPYVPGERTREAALAVLESTYGVSVEGLAVKLPEGITDVAPSALPNLRAGEEVWFVGRVAGPVQGELRATGRVAGEPWEARYTIDVRPTTAAGNAFVPRVWASATIADLELGGRGEDAAKIVALSKAFHVMSRQTSLLVLESEAMFRAFGVDRARPSIEWTGEESMETAVADAVGTRGGSGLGISGTGLGGAGAGYGSGAGDLFANPYGGTGSGRARRAAPSTTTAGPRPMAAPAEAAAPAMDRDDALAEREESRAQRAPMVPPPPPGGGRLMRRVSFLEGHIERSGVRESDRRSLEAAEAAARENPNSRDRLRELVRALSRAGELERAEAAVEQWIARDALDAEALTYQSDVLGRLGRREEALRVLTGVVDLDRDSEILHQRLVSAFTRVGEVSRACDHRVALAEIDATDAEVVAAAVRCERQRGRATAAERLLRMVPDASARARVDALTSSAEVAEQVRGDLVLEATWTGGDDVDLTIVTPQGTRLSWMGGRRNVVASDGSASGVERLGLRRAGVGSYLVEVNRTRGAGGPPIRGQVRVRTETETQVLPFELVGSSAVLGRVDVVRRWTITDTGTRF